ncbi:hypothetical protein [Mucisphaera calidilacus]|nr:hypothetical protein [Mucisphaera calidilacus]
MADRSDGTDLCLTSWFCLGVRFAVVWVLVLVVGSAAVAEPVAVTKTNPTRLYMHYMPWFETPETLGGNRWGWHWTMNNRDPNRLASDGRPDIASHYDPLIGPYASSDPDVIEYHLLLMKLSGVDGVLIDWYGVEGTNGDIDLLLTNSDALVAKMDDFGMEFAVVLEDRFSANVGQAQANVAYLRDHYFGNPWYIRQGPGDDPLMMVFGPITFETQHEWQQILTHGGENVDFLTLWYESGDAGVMADGEYAWPYPNGIFDPGGHLGHLDNFYRHRIPSLERAGGVAYPGFVDFYAEGGAGAGYAEIPHLDGQTLSDTLGVAAGYADDLSFVQLATWNDFGEGTIFEPTYETGFDYLEILQGFSGVGYDVDDLELVLMLYEARKVWSGDMNKQQSLDAVASHLAALRLDEAKALLYFTAYPWLIGDANEDGSVNLLDLSVLAANFGGVGPFEHGDGDFNADDRVDLLDLSLLAVNFGSGSIPEPSVAWGFAALAGVCLRRIRERAFFS